MKKYLTLGLIICLLLVALYDRNWLAVALAVISLIQDITIRIMTTHIALLRKVSHAAIQDKINGQMGAMGWHI